jgi:rod shape-determining protein MreD
VKQENPDRASFGGCRFTWKRAPGSGSWALRNRTYTRPVTRSKRVFRAAGRHSESSLTIPFAALLTILAALIETTVLPELPIAGATADLVLVCATCAAIVLGIEDGLAAAFLGGLMIDLLVPGRPLGAATLSLLLVLSLAMIVARVGGPSRRWLAIAMTVVLTPLLHGVMAVILVATEGVPLAFPVTAVLVAAFMNGVVAIPLATLFAAIEHRFGTTERVDW